MIRKIYCGVHLNFEELMRLGTQFRFMDIDAYFHYQEVKMQQELLIRQVLQDPDVALIYVPFLPNITKVNLEEFQWFDQALIKREIEFVNEMKTRLGDRFMIVIDSSTDNPYIDILEPLRERNFTLYNLILNLTSQRTDLKKLKKFDIGKDAQFNYFGELESGCVYRYGTRIADLLGIPLHKRHLETQASIEYGEITHEDEVHNDLKFPESSNK